MSTTDIRSGAASRPTPVVHRQKTDDNGKSILDRNGHPVPGSEGVPEASSDGPMLGDLAAGEDSTAMTWNEWQARRRG